MIGRGGGQGGAWLDGCGVVAREEPGWMGVGLGGVVAQEGPGWMGGWVGQEYGRWRLGVRLPSPSCQNNI